MLSPAEQRRNRLEGWKAIANAIGVSESRAVELAHPMRKIALPVRYGANGPYIEKSLLNIWFWHFDAPFGLHTSLKGSFRHRRRAEAEDGERPTRQDPRNVAARPVKTAKSARSRSA